MGEEGPAGVEDPEAVFGVEHDALDADEVVLVVGACRRCGGVVDGTSRWVVDFDIGVGCFVRVACEFSDGVLFVFTSCIRVVGVEAGRVVRELAAAAGDAYVCQYIVH